MSMAERIRLRDTLKKDLARLREPCFKSFLLEFFFPKGNMFRYIFWFRVMQKFKSSRPLRFFSPVVYFIFRHYEFKYQIHGNSNIHVGKGLKIVHGDGVHLNASYIGDNFTCYQGVTLGEKNGLPKVGNNVTVYPGAVIVGPVILNDGSVIGANAFVNKDVPANEVWAGVPAKQIGTKPTHKSM